jgi:hypothetical protein
MKQTLEHCFPTEISEADRRAGFRHMVLALEGFIGPSGDHLEVVAKKLSDADLLIKTKWVALSPRDKGGVWYRHIRFGFPMWAEHISSVYTSLRFGCWRTWLSAVWLRRVEWQHIPHAFYESPTDDCSQSLAWNRVVGVPFEEYVP